MRCLLTVTVHGVILEGDPPTVRYGGGNIMVWGCFAASGTEELIVIKS